MKRTPSLALVLLMLAATLLVGQLIKAPCSAGGWSDGRQYKRLCYTDIVPLYGTEHLDGDRLPYLDECPSEQGACDEYPVLTMYAMRATASVGPSGLQGFYFNNVMMLTLCALLITVMLWLLVGPRALYFALAPTLAVYSFINWDLIAVALATGATFAFLRKRPVLAGVLLGLGASAKFYPALLVIPFALELVRRSQKKRAAGLALAATGAWLATNLPFMIAAPNSWFEFFRFNSARPPDWDSMWFVGCNFNAGGYECLSSSVPIVNAISTLTFIALVAFVWWLKVKRQPDFPRWSFGLALLILFLLSNKVYSPQFSLWLLPWFALVLPDIRLFAAFQVTDIAVFVTRFLFFADLTGMDGGVPFWIFQTMVLLRAVVLLGCVGAWVVRRSEDIPSKAPVEPSPDPAAEWAAA